MSNFLNAEGNFIQNHAEGARPDFINKQSSIRSADDLAKQSKVKAGSIRDGASSTFFRVSKIAVYERLYAQMMSKEANLVDTVEEGIERVKSDDEDYIFFTDSTLADYHVAQNCDLTRIGGNLNSVGYGVATPMGSKWREQISLAILELRENGELHKLERKWWYDMAGSCSIEGKSVTISNDRLLFYHSYLHIN